MRSPDNAGQAGEEAARLRLLDYLKARSYHFIAPTPATHRLVRNRAFRSDRPDLRDIFGWSRSFAAETIDPQLLDMMRSANFLEPVPGSDVFRARYRVSTLDGRLHLHSAPSSDPRAVFLGPDSYRYTRFLGQAFAQAGACVAALDIGTGAGVGALALAARYPGARVVGSDINPDALQLARLNAAHNGLAVSLVECSGLPDDRGTFDLICANPPYIAGSLTRLYRDGGGDRGEGLALSWAAAGLQRLATGGRFILYTGSAIVDGHDGVRSALAELAEQAGCSLVYEEIDPDVFGSSLGARAYADVERIAAVGAILTAG